MSVYFNKARKKWEARLSYEGNRYYIGVFKTEKLAIKAVEQKEAELKKILSMNLDNYKMHYEKPRKNKKTWLQRIRQWQSDRKRDRAIEEAIEKL